MKRTILAIAGMVLFVTAVTAQSKKESKSLTWGIRAGFNLQNINGRDLLDNKLENKLVPRFHAGVNAELSLADDFYVQPGLLFSTKGTKFKGSNSVLNLSYIEVPLNFLYKPVLGNGKLLLGVGPYFAFGIGGKLKPTNGNDASVVFENEVDVLQISSGRYYRGFDAGGNLLFGYEVNNNLSVQLNAQLGMLNISPEIKGVSNNNINLKNTGFGLSFGYRF